MMIIPFLHYTTYTGYGLVIAFGLLTGSIYTFAPRIMPYHQQALGIKWEHLSKESRWMLLNYQRSVAAGFITNSITILILLCGPYSRGEWWSMIAIFAISFLQSGNIAYRTWSVKRHTRAKPPLGALLILLAIIIISFTASVVGRLMEASV